MIRKFGTVTGIADQPPGLNVGLGSGNAAPADVLSGKTFTNDGGGAVGAMPNRANDQEHTNLWTPGTGGLSVGFPTGAYITDSGFGAGIASVGISEPNFLAQYIQRNIPMFGLTGTGPPPFASGTVTSSSTRETIYSYDSGGTSTYASATVTGLAFQPSKVFLWTEVSAPAATPGRYIDITSFRAAGWSTNVADILFQTTSANSLYRDNGNWGQPTNGFKLPINSESETCYWIAIKDE